MIKFKYNLKNALVPLVQREMTGFTKDFIVGYLSEGYANQLKRCKLYLCCKYDYNGGIEDYSNPVAIVAPNENIAASEYFEIFEEAGFIHSELETTCNNLEVETL